MEKRETRTGHMESVQQKIITASKELFLTQGYRKTTIQQIVKRSGVTSGSIYHIYGNKEKIFQATADYVIKQVFEHVDEKFAGETPIFRLAANLSLELLLIADDPIVREIYYEALTSDYLFERAVGLHIGIAARLLPEAVEANARARHVLIFCGAMRAYIVSLSFADRTALSTAALQRELLGLALSHLGLPALARGDLLRRIEAAQGELLAICHDVLTTTKKE